MVRSCRRRAQAIQAGHSEVQCRQVQCGWANVVSDLTFTTSTTESMAGCERKRRRPEGGTIGVVLLTKSQPKLFT